MAKPRNKCLDYIAYVALRLFTAFVQMLPLRLSYRLAALVAQILYRLDHGHRKRALGHLKRSFPQWSDRRIELVARASVRSVTYLGMEMLLTPRLLTPARWRSHLRLGDMTEVVQLLVERPSALIMVTGHFGNWEVLGYAVAVLGFPNVAIARRMDNPFIHEYVTKLRQQGGLRILDKLGAARELEDLLEAKQVVSFVVDQDAGRKGVFVDFFGRKASTNKAIALMAMRHEAPIVVGYARRLDARYNFEIGIEQIIYPHDWADQDDPLRWVTQTYSSALERVVRRDPTQYLWMHRRWKTRPPGEQRRPDGIS